jgi:hypothetical protein
LREWSPPERAILLVGPSAGHCLPFVWLRGFERVAAGDPDPMARVLFTRRFGREVPWSARDYFTPKRGRFEIDGVRELLAEYPGHAVLFCNFLGQVPFLAPKASFEESFVLWKRKLPEALEGRSWASFHDRMSGGLRPALDAPRDIDSPLSDPAIVREFYEAPNGERVIELSEHLSGDLFPGRPRRFFSWELSPGTWHLIEGVSSR